MVWVLIYSSNHSSVLLNMVEKIIQRLIELFSVKSYKGTAIKVGIFLAVILPVVIVVALGYIGAKTNLTELTLARRESLASLSAVTVKERFDRLVDIGTSLSNRVLMRQMVREGKWNEAMGYLGDVLPNFPFIERVALIDTTGTARVLNPDFPGIAGTNFAQRDWYKGVSKGWKPYVSEIFKGATNQNTIVVSVPIVDTDGKVLGILNLQVITDTLYGWSKGLDVGEGGFVYFVDKNGNMTGNPKVSPQDPIMSGSNIAYVRKAIEGQSGVEVVPMGDGKIEHIVSYAPVSGYGWGAIVEQPNPPAFALRDNNLKQRLMINGLILAILVLLMYFIVRFINVLNAYRQRERIFLDSIGDGIVAIDRYWNITLWNKTAGELSGWSKEEAMGKPLRESIKFISEADRKENIMFIEDAIVRGKTGFMENNTVLIRKDGTEMPVGDSAAPIFDGKGMVIGAIIIFRDVSHERDRQRMRSDFAYASHQLRTPVTKALWSLEAAKDKKTVKDMGKEVDTAYQAMQSLNRLSDQLIGVSKIDQKTRQVEKQPVKLTDLLDPSIKKANENGVQRAITIVAPLVPMTASIITDQKLFECIIDEVLDNAIKYSEPNSTVKMTVEVKEDMLGIAVEDSGLGILEEEKPLVFTKFFRGHNIDTTAIAGAGLGLYIAQEYAKLLRGKIWFEPKEKGTTFYISLPVT